MSDYPGYPQYVIVAFPKSGTKTMNKVFSNLGFKVFDITQMSDHAVEVDIYKKLFLNKKNLFKFSSTSLAEKKQNFRIWPKSGKIISMTSSWNQQGCIGHIWLITGPKQSLFTSHVMQRAGKTRSCESSRKLFKKPYSNFSPFITTVFEPKDSLVHVLTRNPFISPSHNEVVKAHDGYALNMIGMKSRFILFPTGEDIENIKVTFMMIQHLRLAIPGLDFSLEGFVNFMPM